MPLRRLGMIIVLGITIAALVVGLAACGKSKSKTAAAPLNMEANTVIGSQGATNPANICVVSSRFQQGQSVVWRIKVYDPVTGKPMDDSTLSSVTVSLPDGQTLSAKYGGHPGQPGVPPTDYFWSTVWSIPKDYPTGSVSYKVAAASKDGRTGSFNEFNVAPSLLTVVPAQ